MAEDFYAPASAVRSSGLVAGDAESYSVLRARAARAACCVCHAIYVQFSEVCSNLRSCARSQIPEGFATVTELWLSFEKVDGYSHPRHPEALDPACVPAFCGFVRGRS